MSSEEKRHYVSLTVMGAQKKVECLEAPWDEVQLNQELCHS
jgi:hypothetical protein